MSEALTLARAQRTAEGTPEAIRNALASELALGRQKADAAEALFDNGHPAEAIKLARDALQHTLRAVETLASPSRLEGAAPEPDAKASEPDAKASEPDAKASEPDAKASELDPKVSAASWRRTLLARGAAVPTLDAVQAVLEAVRANAAPRLDEDVKPDDTAAFHRVLAARVALDREVHAAALAPAQIQAQRRNRLAALTVVVVGSLVGAFFLLRTPTGTFAAASEHFGGRSEYAPENAIDGRPDTEWLLPDRVSGWLEVRVSPPRRVEAVSILNAHNPPMNDRATRDYTLEVWSNGELARTIDGSFAFSAEPEPVRHDVGVDAVERVRVVVRSSHHYGGGLAEVTLE
ncbi:MAG: hypothetical protein OHK0013_44850 [Sandaracinaceae bacterium]